MEFGRLRQLGLLKGFLLMGMVWSSLTAIPSSADTDTSSDANPTGMPTCWAKIDNCLTAQTGIDLMETDVFSPLCCPVLKQQIKDVKCFCSIKDYFLSMPTESSPSVVTSALELTANQFLAVCEVDGSFQDMCKGVDGVSSSEANNLKASPAGAKGGSNKISSIGLPLVLGLICAILVYY